MPKLISNQQAFDPKVLDGWTRRRRNAVVLPETSAQFLRLLKKKRRARLSRSRRFFGEIYVASITPHREVHYSSAKWLTNSRFADVRKLADPDHERLRSALHRHFGQARIVKAPARGGRTGSSI